MKLQINPICPACKRHVGLYDKQGNLIACEWHNVKKHDRSSIYAASEYGYIFKVQPGYICDKTKQMGGE